MFLFGGEGGMNVGYRLPIGASAPLAVGLAPTCHPQHVRKVPFLTIYPFESPLFDSNKNTPAYWDVFVWRRGRDSNPRADFNVGLQV